MKIDNKKSEFLSGTKGTIPLMIGALPFGIIFGTLCQESGLSFGASLAMSFFVFAGASQFIVLGILASGGSLLLAVMTTFVVNLRHLIYATSLIPYLKGHSFKWKALLAFFITDETFLVAIKRYEEKDISQNKHWYQLGSSIGLYLFWAGATLLGLTLHRTFPIIASLGLEFAMPATFIAMALPYIKSWPMALAAITAGVVAILTFWMPHKLGLMLAIFSGMLTGIGSEYFFKRRGRHE